MSNPFFKNTGPHDLDYLLKSIDLKNQNHYGVKINDITDLYLSNNGNIKARLLLMIKKWQMLNGLQQLLIGRNKQ